MTPNAVRPTSLAARLAWLGILSALVDLGSAYVKVPLAPRGVTAGDLIQLLGTFPLLALYGSIALDLHTRHASPRLALLLFVAGVTFALGSGVHVAANSIHDMLDHTKLGDPWGLAYFWDEHLGHYMVDASRAAFAVALTALESKSPGAAEEGAPWPLLLGALAYGFIYFATGVEGQTVPLALGVSVGFAMGSLARGGMRTDRPVRTFYAVAAITSIVLFLIWGVWHRGFPEFSRTGLL
ncbi:MAG TPA: hypothetical protein VHU20_05045 [Candidatus Eisenbacteria bacterium]|nr:hypothetical protein [Candidatus Eisenbacteria bacterium]